MDYHQITDEYCELANERLKSYFQNDRIPETLRTAMEYSIWAGGKRLRPCLTLAVCDMLGADREAVLPLACGIEMIHTYSLIHDDLPAMDNDDFRRGKPSNHKVFGEAMAILAGDGLLTYAFEVMLNAAIHFSHEIPTYIDAISFIAECAGVIGMVAGQVADMENEKNMHAGEAELSYIHKKKTAAIITAAIMAGAYMKPAQPQKMHALMNFGESLGLLFQITDDILDVCGDSAVLGKTTGKDKDSEKLTYPKIYGLEESRARAVYLAKQAGDALLPFAPKDAYLQALLQNTLKRNK